MKILVCLLALVTLVGVVVATQTHSPYNQDDGARGIAATAMFRAAMQGK